MNARIVISAAQNAKMRGRPWPEIRFILVRSPKLHFLRCHAFDTSAAAEDCGLREMTDESVPTSY